MCSKAPFHFEPGLEQFEDSTSHVLSRYGYSFDLTGEIEGFVSTYVMTRKYNGALFFFFALCRSVLLSNRQSVTAPLIIPCIYTHYKAQENKNPKGD